MTDNELGTLIITDAVLTMLEEQRKEINGIMENDSFLSCLTENQQDALAAIQNMLNEWSDERYFAANICEKYLEVNNMLALMHKIKSMDPEDLKGFPVVTPKIWADMSKQMSTTGISVAHTELDENGDTKATLISSRAFNSFEPGE